MVKISIWTILFILLALALSACSVSEFNPTPTLVPERTHVVPPPTPTPQNVPTPTRTPGAPTVAAPAPTPAPTSIRVTLAAADTATPAPSSTTSQPAPAAGSDQPPASASQGGASDRWTGNPACVEEFPPDSTVKGPLELNGAVCGLLVGEKAAVVLRRATEIGSVILTLLVGNGDWGRPSVEVGPGVYVLEATTGGVGHVGFPAAYAFTLPEGATAWKLGGLTFDFSNRGGTPGTLGVPRPFLQGALSGLSEGEAATITVYSMGRVEGRCYSDDVPPGCTPPPGPEPLQDAPDLSGARLIASFEAEGPQWGLVSTDLQPGRYLVVAAVADGVVMPAAYGVDITAERFVSGSIAGLDFVFADSP